MSPTKIKRLVQKIKLVGARFVPPDRQTRLATEKLRGQIRQTKSCDNGNSTSEWQKNISELKENILEKDPRFFLTWPVIQYTMFHELASSKDWPRWETALQESKIGYPPPYRPFRPTSGNLVHHAYSLAKLLKLFPVEVKNFRTVIEFGGGYGSFARLLYQFGFTGLYVIYDLPEFSALQEFFLNNLNNEKLTIERAPAKLSDRKIVLISSADDLANQTKLSPTPDLFVALWSLSESPAETRIQTENIIGNSSYVLIAFQEKFANIDNKKYFQSLQSKKPEFIWQTLTIDHLPGNYYLIGKKTNDNR